ncbi:glycosyltransferase family 4 protein [Paenarthrobacter ureafaciens]|uniref:glycosyltransferase family 4 protein n=1 Tax=Paenarthrobacter ureafaciens TaxID=37931 RepID=UPI001407BB6C|nr:glycosyltransferase [Paenarthrobacter ureafaciens]MCX8455421.1 glycosyltransferase [Paenarthrobacter ureafaciens]MCY0973479.1 glycosyltransferase [Paenarthrobacter ureafaciens]
MDIRFVVPGNIRHGSGGNKYNAALAQHLTALGAQVETVTVDGDWPVGSEADRKCFAQALDGGTTVIADGLVASGAPDEVAAAVASGTSTWILSHMALAGHPQLEGKALAAASGVICPSEHAAIELRARHGDLDILVSRPGVEPGIIAAGSDPLRIVAVSALLPNKQQTSLVEALSQLTDLPWSAVLVGSPDADPVYAAKVRAAVEHHGLESRVTFAGELGGEALEDQWHMADLSVLISTSEAFGMVVVESLAHGVPVLVRQGTGAVEALGGSGAGAALDLDAPGVLAEALRTWLTDAELRRTWRDAALAARGRLQSWETTAQTVLMAIEMTVNANPEASDWH